MSFKEQQNDEQFEQLLREKLEPQKAGWEVDRKILEAIFLKDKKSIKRNRYWAHLRQGWIAGLGMAAAIAITFLYFTQFQSESEQEAANPGTISPVQFGTGNPNVASMQQLQYRAVEAKNKLVGVEDNGWTTQDEDTVTRELKYDYIDTVDFVNEEDGTIMRMQIPRQEIVNVSYQVI